MISFKANYFKKGFKTILLLLIIISSKSYSQEHALDFKLKQAFKKSKDTIYVSFTPTLLSSSDKIRKIKDFNNLEFDIQEELKEKYQTIISNTNDSIILSIYRENLLRNLEDYGFIIIEVGFDTIFNTYSQNTHRLNVVQIELEEVNYTDTLKDEKTNLKFTKELTGVYFNTWVRYNQEDSLSQLLFFNNSSYLPFMQGSIIKKDNKNVAEYTLNEATPNTFYNLSKENAIQTAQYYFNFLMNKHVFEQGKEKDKKYYYSIDPYTKTIYYDETPFDLFEIIEEP
ncbi:MAG: hypothetical protein RBR79_04380 [Bacteroidales bacterium]|jgi:hypothetical protein|nr:hypothetical protein [Bacteroidales bacterium]